MAYDLYFPEIGVDVSWPDRRHGTFYLYAVTRGGHGWRRDLPQEVNAYAILLHKQVIQFVFVEKECVGYGSRDAEIRTGGKRVRFHGRGDVAKLRHGRGKNGKCEKHGGIIPKPTPLRD